jgi:hypothetical protein
MRFGVKTLVQTPDLLRFLVHLRERGVEPRRRRPFDIDFPNDIASRCTRQRALEKEAKPAKNWEPPPPRPPPPPTRFTRRKACEEREHGEAAKPAPRPAPRSTRRKVCDEGRV